MRLKTIWPWLLVIAAAVICYCFCTITCAGITASILKATASLADKLKGVAVQYKETALPIFTGFLVVAFTITNTQHFLNWLEQRKKYNNKSVIR